MNTRNLLIVSAVVTLGYGVGLLLIPNIIGPTYGFGTSPGEILLGRFIGVAFLTIGLINWYSKDAGYAALRPVILGNFLGDAVGFIVSLMGTLGGVMTSVGWVSVALYLILSLGFAYFQFKGKQ